MQPNNPIAPDCAQQCPQIRQTDRGTVATYCSSCDAYMEQTVRDMNTQRILDDQR